MSAKKEKEETIDITESIGKAELYIEENKRSLSIIAGAIILLVGGYIAYLNLIVAPEEKEAQSQMFVAENYFSKDSMNLAIKGDGNYPGFEDIIDKYGVTQSANLSHYYLGMAYLHKEEYEKAIEALEDYDADDHLTGSLALGAIGDAYMELNKTDDAISYYLKAAEKEENKFTTPVFLMKAGVAYESDQKYEDAIKQFERIKKEYPEALESRDIGKYITHAKAAIDQ